jgi:uncharacterized protein YfdQ (DUF2303 family)
MADKTEYESKRDDVAASDVSRAQMEGRGLFATLPGGYLIHSLEEFQERPNRIYENRVFADVTSLAGYLGRFETDDSVGFASASSRSINVVIDYHTAEEGSGGDALPSHGDHLAGFRARYSEPYKAWRDLHSKGGIRQKAAGEFLEDRAQDVKRPEPADIMDMVMNFEALKKVDFKSSTRLRDGSVQFVYVEETEARGQVTVPEHLTLFVPVFDGMDPQEIRVRIKFRIEEGRLLFAFEIHDIQTLEDEAFGRCVDALKVARPQLMVLNVA